MRHHTKKTYEGKVSRALTYCATATECALSGRKSTSLACVSKGGFISGNMRDERRAEHLDPDI